MANWTTRLFDEIAVGECASYSRTLDAADIELLVMLTGDRIGDDFNHRPAGAPSTHAIGGSVLLATAVGTQLPGPGARICEQALRFTGRLAVADVLTATVVVREKRAAGRQLLLDAKCTNQHGDTVTEGTLLVDCPAERHSVQRLGEVEVAFHRYNAFQKIFEQAHGQPPVTTAVVHPCDPESLLGALDAAAKGLITPVLVGPEAKIRAAAAAAGVALAGVRIVATEHSHAAADRAVAMARGGEVEALMKGSLHTDELMGAVVAEATGLRTERRVSHVFVMDVPTYPKPLLVTDAAVNIHPDLETKRDICRNAIDLAHVLGIECPKVAILSAVETVNPKIQSTLDAAALCKMAERGQISGATLDGPLAFDNAVSAAAAKIKEIVSPVAGDADILVVPDLEAGNILAKELSYLAAAESAGIVLGARVPIVLTSRADSARTREASAAVMVLLAHALRRRPGAH
jgi:phosphate acetyltransferase